MRKTSDVRDTFPPKPTRSLFPVWKDCELNSAGKKKAAKICDVRNITGRPELQLVSRNDTKVKSRGKPQCSSISIPFHQDSSD